MILPPLVFPASSFTPCHNKLERFGRDKRSSFLRNCVNFTKKVFLDSSGAYEAIRHWKEMSMDSHNLFRTVGGILVLMRLKFGGQISPRASATRRLTFVKCWDLFNNLKRLLVRFGCCLELY